VPIITSTMLQYDPKTFVVTPAPPRAAAAGPARPPLARTLAGVAAAGLATRLVAVCGASALSRRPR